MTHYEHYEEDYENPPPNYDELAPAVTLKPGGGSLRFAALMLAMTLIGTLIGVGSTLAWQIHGHNLTAVLAFVGDRLTAVLAPPPQQTAPETRNTPEAVAQTPAPQGHNIVGDLEEVKQAIKLLNISNQRLVQGIDWLHSKQVAIENSLALRQNEIRQLTDEMASLKSKLENSKPARTSDPAKQTPRKPIAPATTGQLSNVGEPVQLTQPSVEGHD